MMTLNQNLGEALLGYSSVSKINECGGGGPPNFSPFFILLTVTKTVEIVATIILGTSKLS